MWEMLEKLLKRLHAPRLCVSRWSWWSVQTWRMSSTTKRWKHLNIQSRYKQRGHWVKRRHSTPGGNKTTQQYLVSFLRFYPSSSGGGRRATSCRLSFGNRWSTRCLLNAERRCLDARYVNGSLKCSDTTAGVCVSRTSAFYMKLLLHQTQLSIRTTLRVGTFKSARSEEQALKPYKAWAFQRKEN